MRKSDFWQVYSYFQLLMIVAFHEQVAALIPDLNPRNETWIVNGSVSAIAQTDNKIYLGGSFNYIGPNTGYGAPIDISSGEPDMLFPKVDDCIETSMSDGAGGWYIGGRFEKVGEFDRNRVAHILADGTVDPNWKPEFDGRVYCFAKSDSTIYVGGQFFNVNGQSRKFLAAVDTSGTLLSWNPDADDSVFALELYENIIIAAGNFSEIGGKSRGGIAKLDADSTGTATEWSLGVKDVKTMKLVGENLYIGGDFKYVGPFKTL